MLADSETNKLMNAIPDDPGARSRSTIRDPKIVTSLSRLYHELVDITFPPKANIK